MSKPASKLSKESNPLQTHRRTNVSLCTISAWALQAPYCINNANTTTLIGWDIVFRRSKSQKKGCSSTQVKSTLCQWFRCTTGGTVAPLCAALPTLTYYCSYGYKHVSTHTRLPARTHTHLSSCTHSVTQVKEGTHNTMACWWVHWFLKASLLLPFFFDY